MTCLCMHTCVCVCVLYNAYFLKLTSTFLCHGILMQTMATNGSSFPCFVICKNLSNHFPAFGHLGIQMNMPQGLCPATNRLCIIDRKLFIQSELYLPPLTTGERDSSFLTSQGCGHY